MKKGDKIVFIVIVVIISLGFLGKFLYKNAIKSNEKIAVIKQDGKIFKKIDLSKVTNSQEITIKTKDNHFNKILIEKNKISIIDADCPDKVCIKTGPISEPGDTIVCLPNKLIITIDGSKANSEIDATTF
ncbi:hypothetical protein BD780_002096 [Clostridium tetanomorphum]|uniref:NusG domain II-containing protein n=1 Tax=Clostridium tetanomorphum TaxID=1553 RepID=A0A923E9Q0_CLOTT|nr:NusG domain II-containing protein [Clostridium tetanomorphum]KAJ52779.1 hypothetical protein CTM_05580 [Clostridium tetanomorphum DSM 665]MBC2396470.1 NusG domain II-containing protein [Clostridium tetanomorphum]MBP1865362.1 hypothetical protein [Clostridium tetanomorphum]NRS84871.1 hypothetical protein [Clostridium tetanomorphum]NRZ98088.1 hypothetical protein [Clostridium tetanomorphum]